jgi:hypothetical protein
MSGTKDTEKAREDGGKARRTYATLVFARGMQYEKPRMYDGTQRAVVSIAPMLDRTYWIHVGGGKATSSDALYEKVEEDT